MKSTCCQQVILSYLFMAQGSGGARLLRRSGQAGWPDEADVQYWGCRRRNQKHVQIYDIHITYIYIYIYIHIRICMTYKNRSLSVWSEIMLNDVWCDIRWCCVLQDNLKKFILVESSRYIFFRVIHCMIEHVNVNAYAWRVDPAPIKQEELKAFGISLWVRNAL